MVRLIFIYFLILCIGSGCNPGGRTDSPSTTSYRAKKLVFIILDGIPADVVESVKTPKLEDIAKAGSYTRAYTGGEPGGATETPTISAVGYNSLITGTWANKHNVYGNGIENPNYSYWNIFRIAKEDNPALHTAIFSTWRDNRVKLIGEGLPEAGGIQLDYAFDGFEWDTVRFPHDEGRRYIFDIDEYVSKEAASYILDHGPELSWVYLEFTDDMGHMFGDSPELRNAVQKADVQVGRIWDSIQSRQKEWQEDWMILITTDHGRTAIDGKGHGGQSERERTIWFFCNQKLNLQQGQLPALVDGLPTMLDFMDIEPPKEIASNFDGKSILLGDQ